MVNAALEPVTCRVCSSNSVKSYCEKDSSFYHICKECSSIFQHPLPEPSRMSDYADSQYQSGDYRNYVSSREMKHAHFDNRLKQFESCFPKGRLLDVGCSCGYFLDIALAHGYDAYGVELSQAAIAAANPATRDRIKAGTVDALKSQQMGSFDLVTAFDIIEHTRDPIDFLQQVKSVLKPGGGIVLTTPDTGHFLRYVLGKRWAMLQPLQHTVLFSRRSLAVALSRAGFRNICITTAYKTLSIEYLIQQVREHHPQVFSLYNLIRPLIPIRAREGYLNINIGEMLATASISE